MEVKNLIWDKWTMNISLFRHMFDITFFASSTTNLTFNGHYHVEYHKFQPDPFFISNNSVKKTGIYYLFD